MLEDEVKKAFEKVIGKKVLALQKIGLNATRITVLSIFSSIIAAFLFYEKQIFLGALFAILDYLFDGFDGLFARVSGSVSNEGYILDHFSDYVIRRLWYFALAAGGYISYELLAWALFSFSVGIFLAHLALIKRFRMPRWSFTMADWLIIPAALTGNILVFFQLMVIIHFIMVFINLSFMIYLNK
ncbi:CDP-alcohol phosphatidyltransferase family protein [[Eubacterium] cellulosolvens]